MEDKNILIETIYKAPKGSIWQERYIALPMVVIFSTITIMQPYGSFLTRLAYFILGGFLWTFFEYFLHRFAFHYQPKSVIGKALLDRFHIYHHNDTKDETQVCIPLYISLPAWALLFGIFSLFLGFYKASLFISGFALMTIIYDIVHFSTHYMPARNPFLKFLKKHHALHHFSDHHKRFGVTSPLWDFVFRTYK